MPQKKKKTIFKKSLSLIHPLKGDIYEEVKHKDQSFPLIQSCVFMVSPSSYVQSRNTSLSFCQYILWPQLLRLSRKTTWSQDCQHRGEICLNKTSRIYLSTSYSSFSISEMLFKKNTQLLEWFPSFRECLGIFFTMFINIFPF